MHKIYFTATFILLIMYLTSSEKSSDLYVDNGDDQTILYKVASKERRHMERNLLNIFGLPDRPRGTVPRSLTVTRSAPKFLLNIYQNVLSNSTAASTNEEYENVEEFNFSDKYIDIIDGSDFIMTFAAHNPYLGNGFKLNRGRRIWFNVSEVPVGQNIISAELRLYQSLNKDVELRKAYIIAVYRVAQIKHVNRTKLYIDSTTTMTDKSGWIILNVTRALEYWVKHPKENRGLFLAVYRNDYAGRIIRPDDIGIVGVSGVSDKQPFMVGFFKGSGIHRKYDTLSRQKRDVGSQNHYTNGIDVKDNPYINLVMRKRRENLCSMRTLYISFKELRWHDWIIAPDGYDAYYCSGECNFPINARMNATNHAIVQTLIHLVKPHEVPKPCCAPTKLSPISVIYFLDDNNVVLKKYENMVIVSCGCL